MEVSLSKTHLVHTHKLSYFAEVEVNMMKLYMSQPKAGGSYKVSVDVVDGSKLVCSHHFPMQTFHQFAVNPYEAKADKNSDHALTLTGLNHMAK
jgi:hypothetical protein